jgi:hypothetical protein
MTTMKTDKLKLEDCCLTIEQAKELEELGVDFSNANFAFINVINPYNSTFKHEITKYYVELRNDLIPTLSVAEMMEMLPMDIEAKSKKYGNQTVYLSIDRHSVMYFVSGQEFERGLYIYKSFEKPLLRDALFEAIRWLKQNKLI